MRSVRLDACAAPPLPKPIVPRGFSASVSPVMRHLQHFASPRRNLTVPWRARFGIGQIQQLPSLLTGAPRVRSRSASASDAAHTPLPTSRARVRSAASPEPSARTSSPDVGTARIAASHASTPRVSCSTRATLRAPTRPNRRATAHAESTKTARSNHTAARAVAAQAP